MKPLMILALTTIPCFSWAASGKPHTAPQKAPQKPIQRIAASIRPTTPPVSSKLSIEGKPRSFDVVNIEGKGYLSLDDVALLLGGKITPTPGGFVLSPIPAPISIAKDSDIELHGTYGTPRHFNGYDSIIYSGSITNTGIASAPVVQVTCRVAGFHTFLKNAASDAESHETLDPNVFQQSVVATFKNMRPGETRNLSEIIPIHHDLLTNLPEDRLAFDDVPPSHVDFHIEVKPD